MQGTATAPSRAHRCDAAVASAFVNEMDADVVAVGVATGAIVGAPGGTLSTVHCTVAEPGR